MNKIISLIIFLIIIVSLIAIMVFGTPTFNMLKIADIKNDKLNFYLSVPENFSSKNFFLVIPKNSKTKLLSSWVCDVKISNVSNEVLLSQRIVKGEVENCSWGEDNIYIITKKNKLLNIIIPGIKYKYEFTFNQRDFNNVSLWITWMEAWGTAKNLDKIKACDPQKETFEALGVTFEPIQ